MPTGDEHVDVDPFLLASSYVDTGRSRFTYRDIRDLGRASTITPLRVVALIDFDAFYAQCETVRLGLAREQPLAVQQWNHIIALNYAAREAGLKRGMTADAARTQCPEIVLQHVATWREGSASWAYRADVRDHLKTDKAALDPYRLQSRKAFDLIKSKLMPPPLQKVEKAGIDEVFCDLSMQVYKVLLERYPELEPMGQETESLDSYLPLPPISLLDWKTDKLVETGDLVEEAEHEDWDDVALNIGSEIVRHVRADIYEQLHYTCSAGVARNKPLAKLAAGHNKPNRQTVVRARDIHAFLALYKYTKIRGLAGKLGQQIVAAFNTNKVTDLRRITKQALCSKIGSSSGAWVYNVIRGHEYSEVVERTTIQTMLSAKTFVPRLQNLAQAEKWLRIFAGDLMGRLNDEDAISMYRRPKVIAFHHHIDGRFGPTRSKQTVIPLTAEMNSHLLFSLSRELLSQLCTEGPSWPCLGLSVSLSDFQDLETGNRRLTSFFSTGDKGDAQTQAKSEQHRLTISQHDSATTTTPIRKRGLLAFDGFQSLPPNENGEKSEIQHNTAKRPKVLMASLSQCTPRSQIPPGTSSDFYDCPRCNQKIAALEVLEHLDWHVAIDLQQTEES